MKKTLSKPYAIVAMLHKPTYILVSPKFNNLAPFNTATSIDKSFKYANNYSTNNSFAKKNIVDQVFSKHNNSNIRHFSTAIVSGSKKLSTSHVSSSVLPYGENQLGDTSKLDPVKYKLWTKEQVCSLLCNEDNNGGASLVIEQVKPLYDAGFNGTSIGNIVNNNQQYGNQYAIDETCKSFPKISRDLITAIVIWVDKLYKKKLYHSWSAKELREELCKPISAGGAGLSEKEYSPFGKANLDGQVLYQLYQELAEIESEPNFENYWNEALEDILSNYDISYTKTEEATWTKIKNFISKKQIVYNPFLFKMFDEELFPSFSIGEKEKLIEADIFLNNKIDKKAKNTILTQEEKNWYNSFAKLALKGKDQINRSHEFKSNYGAEVTKLMNEAMELMPNSNKPPLSKDSFNTILQSLKKLLENATIPDIFMTKKLTPQIDKESLSLDNRDLIRNVKVPMDSNYQIAKDLLPFIPEFQYDLLEEKEKLNSYFNSGSTVVAIGPGGLGKTALIIRRLGINPGVFITCTSNWDAERLTERGKDLAAYSLCFYITKIKILLYNLETNGLKAQGLKHQLVNQPWKPALNDINLY